MTREIVIAVALALIAGCSQGIVLRGDLSENIPPLLKIEDRADRIKAASFRLWVEGNLDDEKAQSVKVHYDIYFVYLAIAYNKLGQGDFPAYQKALSLAGVEVDAMERLLTENRAEPQSWSRDDMI